MCKIICVSDRALCDDFVTRIKSISGAGIPVILREKDMKENEYKALLNEVGKENIIPHTFIKAARRLGYRSIHLPLAALREADIYSFDRIGASVHSVSEAIDAEGLGASYITAGHIFATDCKKGVPPRGTAFLAEVCKSVKIPVYAIGGITPENAKTAADAGAEGVCVMSGFMRCDDIDKFIDRLEKSLI